MLDHLTLPPCDCLAHGSNITTQAHGRIQAPAEIPSIVSGRVWVYHVHAASSSCSTLPALDASTPDSDSR